jgi:hypothetical protein
MLKAEYVASFIGLKKRKDGTEHAAVFVGLYKVGNHHRLTSKQFWEKAAYQELKSRYGLRGFGGDRPYLLWFDLEITGFYDDWRGKLVVEWPQPPIRWWRWADKAKFPISPEWVDNALHEDMPDWKACIWSCAELDELPNKWRETLRQWRGIYYIFDGSDGKGYVGAAYGRDNILGRWERHVRVGGDSVYLRKRSPQNFTFSILQRVSPDTIPDEVFSLEKSWKDRLHTRWPSGLNDN